MGACHRRAQRTAPVRPTSATFSRAFSENVRFRNAAFPPSAYLWHTHRAGQQVRPGVGPHTTSTQRDSYRMVTSRNSTAPSAGQGLGSAWSGAVVRAASVLMSPYAPTRSTDVMKFSTCHAMPAPPTA